ncbi:unnamed protein product [Brachionus calyciflorus]|uniref:Uncharacterized protein n=1 Tax=Brachionus calyciflorus TaxID=104777 RepID=A0A813MT10_9BILA|nr:unnamed protein product [Brachionus calyciflorus]
MSELAQDLKCFRKIRKQLRQIEHLNLLQRPLNDEEKIKLEKRPFLRDELKQLLAKYPNGELLVDDSKNTTFDTEENSFTSQNNSLVVNKLNEIDELAEKLNEIVIDEEQPQEKIVEETKPIIQKTEPIVESTKKVEPIKAAPPKPPKRQQFTFDTISVLDAHQDLITSIDVDTSNRLLVTGSRDTSIKLWKFDEDFKKCEHIKTFGEHSGVITQLKFWNLENYKTTLENLKKNLDENEILIDSLPELNDDKLTLILSSSLDCSLRIWSVSLGKCIKELYMYNPIKSFDLKETFFMIGQDAGKIQLWNDLKQIKELKPFDEDDNVICVKFLDANKIYTLSHNGHFKIFLYSNQSFEQFKSVNLYQQVYHDSQAKKNFKYFEILNEKKIVFLNDNQSYVVVYDLEHNKSNIVSTNSTFYAFSSCFYKQNDQIFVSSYNIDDATSTLNVFEINDNVSYKYSIQDQIEDDNSHHYSISSLSSSDISTKKCVASGSGRDIKLFLIDCSNEGQSKKSCKQVKYLKMIKQVDVESDSMVESNDESDQELEQEDTDKNQNFNENQAKKSTCSIQ